MKHLFKTMTLAAAGTVAALILTTAGVDRAAAAEPVSETAKLHRMAKEANTAADHAQVAKLFRLQGEAMEAKAAAHEKKAKEFEARPKSPLAHKWPAMAPQQGREERALALQARRAAQESFDLAAKHIQLAVELRETTVDAGN